MKNILLSLVIIAMPFALHADNDAAQQQTQSTASRLKKAASSSSTRKGNATSRTVKESLQKPAAAEESPLVRAAKAGAGRRKASHKVITNDDVKTSRGSMSVVPTGPQNIDKPLTDAEVSAKIAAAVKKETDDAADNHIARIRAEQRVLQAQKRVDALSKDLTQLEQRYYEESDPDFRDNVLEKKYNDSRKQLDEAKKELDDARRAQQTLPRS